MDRETTRKWRAANRDQIQRDRARERKYRAANGDKYNEKQTMNKRKRDAARNDTDVNRLMAGVGYIVLCSQ